MIITELYNGQGLGNQLWCYVVTRVIALEHKFEFGIKSPEKFKGRDFLNLDFGKNVVGGEGPEGGPPTTLPDSIYHYYVEKKVVHLPSGVDARLYDSALMNISDNTKIDGIMQDEQYILKYKSKISKWLKVNSQTNCLEYSSPNICIINFRGGEYVHIKNVFLPQTYWNNAIKIMRTRNNRIRFVVITDDIETARKFFPTFEIYHFNIGRDYSIINNAHYLILSNSSFAFFPAWLNKKLKYCIAPKYWSQYNYSDGYWGCGYNITKKWKYLDRYGNITSYTSCLKELKQYLATHRESFTSDETLISKTKSGSFYETIISKLKHILQKVREKLNAL